MRARRASRVVWSGVVKVQRSLFSGDGVARVLIHDRRRSVEFEAPLTDEMASWFKVGEARAFAEATLNDRGILNIVRKLRGRWPTW